ncbi:hypothetical protein C5167_004610 [Papaver somniferum]|uniref:Uncharacterized protein n=1 Tax=Papaver somniferum TaxID=3469 RepID=A0A4Y7JBY5_PAPSO|nr:hypothetical protein C5167_004610 [Papaver somniferum]
MEHSLLNMVTLVLELGLQLRACFFLLESLVLKLGLPTRGSHGPTTRKTGLSNQAVLVAKAHIESH